jgi:hypothetical protein
LSRLLIVASVVSLAAAVGCGGSSPSSPSAVANTPITVMGSGITTYACTTDVRPLLATDCFSCHGQTVQQNGFNFSTYSGVLQAVTPGSDASLIVRVTQPGGLMYSMLSGDRNQKAGIIYDWVVNSKAVQ